LTSELTTGVFTGRPAHPFNERVEKVDESSCPGCRDKAVTVRLLLGWGSALGGAASLLAAGTALVQIFVR